MSPSATANLSRRVTYRRAPAETATVELLPDGAERRSSERLEMPPVHVTGLRAVVADVSKGGMCLILPTELPKGSRYHITLTDGLSFMKQEVQAEVVWYARGRAGLRWVDLAPEQEAWLEERFQGWQKAARNAWMERGELVVWAG